MNLKHKLHNPVFKVLHKTAIETGTKAFVVGGFVRDILVKRPNKDIDIVVEGNGIDFAKKVANKLENVRGLSVFKNFGTAMIKLGRLRTGVCRCKKRILPSRKQKANRRRWKHSRRSRTTRFHN